jgi:hypothetical protein
MTWTPPHLKFKHTEESNKVNIRCIKRQGQLHQLRLSLPSKRVLGVQSLLNLYAQASSSSSSRKTRICASQTPHNFKMMMQSQVEHKPQNSFLHTCGSQCFRWTSTMSTLLRTLLSYQKTHILWHRHHHTCSVKAGFNNWNNTLAIRRNQLSWAQKNPTNELSWTSNNVGPTPELDTMISTMSHIYWQTIAIGFLNHQDSIS